MRELTNRINLKAPGNWINDPNGFIYYGGKYHLFYQYFPYAPFWGTMHWGHAISDDLVNWEHLGVALHPTKDYDKNGVFSGSAINIDGKMNLYYTAMVYDAERPENIHLSVGGDGYQSQAMIVSENGFDFDNFNDKKLVVPAIKDTSIADPHDCRDPKVFKIGDTYYMVLGTTHLKEKGVLLLMKSYDGVEWSYLNRLESEKLGIILECPDLFEVDGQWFLVCSPIGNMAGKDCYPSQAIIQPVTFDLSTGEVDFDGDNQFMDYGFDLYAPQSNLDENGLRVIISWARMETPMEPTHNKAAAGKLWNGCMAIPRVLEVREGVIFTTPHPNIRKFYESAVCTIVDDGKTEMRCIDDNAQIKTVLSEGQWLDIKGYKIGLVDGCVVGDRSALVPPEVKIHRTSKTPYVGDNCLLEIYVDPDIIEIFVDDGRYVLTHVTYRNS